MGVSLLSASEIQDERISRVVFKKKKSQPENRPAPINPITMKNIL